MTNRRPDVYCDGCGQYDHSLSHRPDEQKWPDRPFYCGSCNDLLRDNKKSSGMLDCEWYMESLEKISNLREDCYGRIGTVVFWSPNNNVNLNEQQLKEIENFVYQMKGMELPDFRDYGKDCGIVLNMTKREWQNISLKKLGSYGKNQKVENIETLVEFIYSN